MAAFYEMHFPESETFYPSVFDAVNLISVDGPICFNCGQNHVPEVVGQPCPGGLIHSGHA
jgi:hypothetical protein